MSDSIRSLSPDSLCPQRHWLVFCCEDAASDKSPRNTWTDLFCCQTQPCLGAALSHPDFLQDLHDSCRGSELSGVWRSLSLITSSWLWDLCPSFMFSWVLSQREDWGLIFPEDLSYESWKLLFFYSVIFWYRPVAPRLPNNFMSIVTEMVCNYHGHGNPISLFLIFQSLSMLDISNSCGKSVTFNIPVSW